VLLGFFKLSLLACASSSAETKPFYSEPNMHGSIREALKQLVEDDPGTMEKVEAKFKTLQERFKREHQGTGT
jgi:hypothetical protein